MNTPAFVAGNWHFWLQDYTDAQTIKAIAELGLDGIEIGIPFPEQELDNARVSTLRGLVDDFGLSVSNVNLFLPPGLWPGRALTADAAPTRRKVIDALLRLGDVAQQLGANTVGLWPGADRLRRGDDYQVMWSRLVSGLSEVLDGFKPSGLNLAYEYKPGEIVGNADSLLLLASQLGSASFGALFDVGHAIMQREDEVIVAAKLRDLLLHVHLDDNYGDYDRDMPPGVVHNFAPLVRELSDGGFTGALGFDLYFYQVEEAKDGETVLRESLSYMRSVYASAAASAE